MATQSRKDYLNQVAEEFRAAAGDAGKQSVILGKGLKYLVDNYSMNPVAAKIIIDTIPQFDQKYSDFLTIAAPIYGSLVLSLSDDEKKALDDMAAKGDPKNVNATLRNKMRIGYRHGVKALSDSISHTSTALQDIYLANVKELYHEVKKAPLKVGHAIWGALGSLRQGAARRLYAVYDGIHDAWTGYIESIDHNSTLKAKGTGAFKDIEIESRDFTKAIMTSKVKQSTKDKLDSMITLADNEELKAGLTSLKKALEDGGFENAADLKRGASKFTQGRIDKTQAKYDERDMYSYAADTLQKVLKGEAVDFTKLEDGFEAFKKTARKTKSQASFESYNDRRNQRIDEYGATLAEIDKDITRIEDERKVLHLAQQMHDKKSYEDLQVWAKQYALDMNQQSGTPVQDCYAYIMREGDRLAGKYAVLVPGAEPVPEPKKVVGETSKKPEPVTPGLKKFGGIVEDISAIRRKKGGVPTVGGEQGSAVDRAKIKGSDAGTEIKRENNISQEPEQQTYDAHVQAWKNWKLIQEKSKGKKVVEDLTEEGELNVIPRDRALTVVPAGSSKDVSQEKPAGEVLLIEGPKNKIDMQKYQRWADIVENGSDEELKAAMKEPGFDKFGEDYCRAYGKSHQKLGEQQKSVTEPIKQDEIPQYDPYNNKQNRYANEQRWAAILQGGDTEAIKDAIKNEPGFKEFIPMYQAAFNNSANNNANKAKGGVPKTNEVKGNFDKLGEDILKRGENTSDEFTDKALLNK